ncbi:alpha/beta hydrolase [Mycobacterium lentiflavum]|nr:alpha/beta hydrolase [Mycobacterium lentiflavum]
MPTVSGPNQGPVVVIAGARRDFTAYSALSRRLHTALFRTVFIAVNRRLRMSSRSVIGLLDALDIRWALLVGGRSGGQMAWTLAATEQQRFSGLVAVDCGHPRVPDVTGVVRDNDCPPVRINTTMLVAGPEGHAVARASGRHVYGDFRVAQLVGGRNSRESTAQLATEIVVRAFAW